MTTGTSPALHRLDLIPMLSLAEPIAVGAIVVGPWSDLGSTMFPDRRLRRSAEGMVRYHRLHNGRAIPNPSVVAADDHAELPSTPSPAQRERIERSIEAFRYAALLANRLGFGPNSTHLHVEAYRFRDKAQPWLTVRSRFTQVLGVRRYQTRSWVHISPAHLLASQLDRGLLDQLGGAVGLPSKAARRLWRGLWWFNQAHHDDPYQSPEFSILSLATAFEALVRPSKKIDDLQQAIATVLGSREFDEWVRAFYGARSAITHGDAAWQPLFGASAHVDHFRIASALFPILVEQRLVDLRCRPPAHPLLLAMHRLSLTRLLSSDEEMIARLLPETFQALRLRRNTEARIDVQFLSVRLNHDDLSTPPARYAELLDWLRRIAVAACRSAGARWPADRPAFRDLARQFSAGIPPLSTAAFIPHSVDPETFLDDLAETPEHRPVLGDISLADLAEAMEAVEGRREVAQLRAT